MTGGASGVAGVAAVGVGYLVGSVPVALLVGRAHHVDPRVAGDGNPGYWNAKALLGRRAAVPVFVGDTVKGTAAGPFGLAVATACGLPPHPAMVVTWCAVAAAMVGHAWPVFAGFRGGRSILTFVGGMAVLSPRTFAVGVAVVVVVSLAARSFAWGARAGMASVPLAELVVDGPYRTAAVGVLLSIIGLRFLQAARAGRRRSGPATAAPDVPPPR
jgi:glycerol-3-phosphate acyltransferase PlsY